MGRAAARQAGACPLEEQECWEETPTRERGRLARMHCRCVALSFSAMGQPASLPGGTAGARPKQSPGAVAGRAGRRSWPRLCQNLCGRDARAAGWASFRAVVTPRGQYQRTSRESGNWLCQPNQKARWAGSLKRFSPALLVRASSLTFQDCLRLSVSFALRFQRAKVTPVAS